MSSKERIVLGIDPGLANTGWGVVLQRGSRLSCVAYGCISTDTSQPLAQRLKLIHEQMDAVIERFAPTCVGIETVWFGQNITAAFATGQARGAALVACAEGGLDVGEFTPRQIKLAVVGTGSAEKEQVQYMVRKLLSLDHEPKPDHASDALAAAICYTTHDGPASADSAGAGGLDALVAAALARDEAQAAARRARADGGIAADGAHSAAAQDDGASGAAAASGAASAAHRGSVARAELLARIREGRA